MNDRIKNSDVTDRQKEQLIEWRNLLNDKMATRYAEALALDSPSINAPNLTIALSDSASDISGLAVKNWSKSEASDMLIAYTSANRLSSTERAAKFLAVSGDNLLIKNLPSNASITQSPKMKD